MIGRNDPLSLAKTRKVTFGSTLSESFTIEKQLDEELLERAAEFWRKRNLSIKRKTLAKSTEGETVMGTLVAEGGTIWTIDIDQYRKAVSASMIGTGNMVEVFVHMELIGAFMSEKDKRKAMDLLEAFQDELSQ